MTDEIIDIFDEKEKKIGQRPKSQAHKQGLWHRSAHIWIYNSKGQILLQKRSKTKDLYPGKWDISAAGHVSLGHTPEECAIKEIYEEIGIKIKPTQLAFLKIHVSQTKIPKLGWQNNEFCYLYLLKLDLPLTKFKFIDGEVEKIKFLDAKIFEKKLKDPKKKKKCVPHEYYPFIIESVRKALRNN